PVGELLEAWSDLAAAPGVVHVGGPVEPTAVIALGGIAPGTLPEGWEPVIGGLRVVDLAADAVLAAAELTSIRVFAGYAGWGPGQLEDELAEDAWVPFPARAEDTLTEHPDALWSRVMARAGVDHRLLATMPDDPAMN
ncbi:MAG TPA: YqgE/AlgH family protein, partial [Nitriliruptorales bacterium]